MTQSNEQSVGDNGYQQFESQLTVNDQVTKAGMAKLTFNATI